MRRHLGVRRHSGLAALLVTAGLIGPASAGEWTYWRGPSMSGVAEATGLVENWDIETGENVVWESPEGGRATPIAMNGRLYFNSRTTDDVADPEQVIHSRQQVVCLDAKTGEVVWRDLFNVAKTDIPAPRVGWASPVGDPATGNVYVHTVDGLLISYSGDGERLWQLDLYEELGKISGYGGRTVTPIIDEDRLIVSFLELNWGDGAKPPPKQTFYAFNKFDGTILWRSQPGGKALDTIYTNPAIGEIGGVRQLVSGNTDGGACGIDARTGEPLWTFRMSKRGLNSSPVIHGDHVIISHGEDNIDTVAKGLGRVQCIDATLRGDITETGSVWRIDGIKAGYTAATLVGDVVYIVSDIGGLHAIDANDGTELWKFQVGTVGKGSPVFADGKLYVPETNGRFWILEPTREGVEVLDQDELQGTTVPGTDEIYASPAVAYGHVYMVTRDRTLCLGSGDFVMPEKPDVAITVLPYNPTPATYDRVRPDNGPLPWSYDFDDLKGPVAVPPAWVNAFLKVKPTADVKGAEGLCMKSSPGPGKPSFDVFLGPSTMTDYVIEADVMVEGRRRLSTVGVTNQKYTLMLKANQAKLDIVTWQAHLRLGSSQRFRARAGKWYRMKLDVEIIEDDSDDGAAIVRGKVWPRDEDEPADWTIECTDPHPNPQGSPGLYTYRLADSYIDNVTVTAEAD